MGIRFNFNPLMMVLTLLFFCVFSALSLWQVYRIFDKQAIVEQIERANSETPLSFSGLPDITILDNLYYRATVEGQFISARCFFVENVVREGQPGLYVYCPFKPIRDKRWLLVNMGWIRSSDDRLDLPDIQVETDVLTIQGVIMQPRSKPVVTSGLDKPNTELERLWVYFDFDSLKKQSGLDFYPVELQLTSEIDPPLVRDWPVFNAKIGMHIGYAIHWAVFALVTLGLFIKFNFKKIDHHE